MKNNFILSVITLAFSLSAVHSVMGESHSYNGAERIYVGAMAEKRALTDKDGYLLDQNYQYPKINGRVDYRYKYEDGKIIAYRPRPGGPKFGYEIDKTYDKLGGTKPDIVWKETD